MGFIEGLGSTASSIGPSLTGAATAVESGAAGAAAVTPVVGGLGGLGKLGEFRGFGEAGGLGIVNEGPVGLAALKLTVPLGEIKFGNEPVSVPDIPLETEPVFLQAQKPEIGKIATSPLDKLETPRNDKLIEPMVMSFPKPEAAVFPATEPETLTGPQTGTGVANKTEPAVATQPALQEQEVEEIVSERTTAKQIDTVEEEIEESRLKNVVDEKVLTTRLQEFGVAVDLVGASVEASGGDLYGGEIVKLVPGENRNNRSGLVKEEGPDGSREEAKEVVASKKFRSIKEAKESIAAIIAEKVPVKKAKEGVVVGYEAVVRVLKYFFGKPKPVEQMMTREVKKKKVQVQERRNRN